MKTLKNANVTSTPIQNRIRPVLTCAGIAIAIVCTFIFLREKEASDSTLNSTSEVIKTSFATPNYSSMKVRSASVKSLGSRWLASARR